MAYAVTETPTLKTTTLELSIMKGRVVWGLISVWMVIIAISLAWSWRQVDISAFELAHVEAQSHFEKDLVYRRWVAMHGGVYVPPTAETPPNPYLAHSRSGMWSPPRESASP